MRKEPANAAGLMLVAKESFIIRWEGVDKVFTGGVTRVREGHPVLEGREHLFEALTPHYEVEAATAAPGEVRGG